MPEERIFTKITPDMTDEDIDALAEEIYARVMRQEKAADPDERPDKPSKPERPGEL